MTNQTISVPELATILETIKKSTVVSLTYKVDDSRSKQVQGKKQVQKRVKITHLYLNHDYEKKVQKLSGDDSFKALEMKGKTRISSTLVKSDKTEELMLDGKILGTENAIVLGYYHDEKEITEKEGDELDLWTNSYYNTPEVQSVGRGLLTEEDFKMITVYLSRIESIKIAGVLYNIEK